METRDSGDTGDGGDTTSAIRAGAFDLDGVLRRFDVFHQASVEMRHGLPNGVLWVTAFEPDLIGLLVTGRITRSEWCRRIGEAVGNPIAAEEWLDAPPTVDLGVLDVVDRFRARGLPTAIVTNGTDTVPAELDHLGLRDHFDLVVNSAEIGVAKPDHRIYHHLCRALDLPAEAVFFADDSAGHVTAAAEVGLVAHRFVDARRLAAAVDGLFGDGLL